MESNQEGIANGGGQQPGDGQQLGDGQTQGNELLQGEDQQQSDGNPTTTDDAEPPKATLRSRQSVDVRVLVACEHGEPNDVVTLPYRVARAAFGAGQVDPDPDAVAYALSLKQ